MLQDFLCSWVSAIVEAYWVHIYSPRQKNLDICKFLVFPYVTLIANEEFIVRDFQVGYQLGLFDIISKFLLVCCALLVLGVICSLVLYVSVCFILTGIYSNYSCRPHIAMTIIVAIRNMENLKQVLKSIPRIWLIR